MAKNRSGNLVWWVAAIALGGVWLGTRLQHEDAPAAVVDAATTPEATPAATAAGAVTPTRDNWPLLETGAAAPAALGEAATSNYVVVLDGSGSMRASECSGGTSKLDAAKRALAHFVRAVPASAKLGLVVFDGEGISERVPLGSDNRDAFVAALNRVEAVGGTPLRSSIELAYDKLTAQGRQQLGYGDYHLVVVTDGSPQPASEDPTPIVNRILGESPVVLHTIGFCIGSDHVLNQPGRSYYVAAESPEQLAQGLGAVLAEAPSFDVTQFKQP